MPTVPFQSYLRLTHTGLQADGVTPNRSSLLINDVDTGYENQNRKSPVYVPVGGFIDVPLTSRVLFSAMQGTVAGFSRTGQLEVGYSSYARDGDNLGGATGTGITLSVAPAQNIRRLGDVLDFAIVAGPDTSGFIVGERITVTGLVGAFAALNGTYTISAFTKGNDFAGANPLTAIVGVPSIGANIPAALHAPGVLLTLPDGMVTHLYVSAGNAGGLGAAVRTYVAGDMVLTGALDPTKIIFSPTDMTFGENVLGVDQVTQELIFRNRLGTEVILSVGAGAISEVISVAKAGGQYTSVAAAIAYIVGVGDASAAKPYTVSVAAGVYDEPPFTLPSYVSISGASPYSVFLRTTNNLAHFITGSPAAELAGVSITGPTNAGFACVNYESVSNSTFKVFNVELKSGYYGVWCHPAAGTGIMICDEVFNYSAGTLNTFMFCSGRGILRGVICAYRDDGALGNTYGFRAEDATAQMYLENVIYKEAGGTGIYANYGAILRATTVNVAAGANALLIGPNTGAGAQGTRVEVLGAVFRSVVTNHIVVNSPVAELLFTGVAVQSKITVATGASFVANFADPTGGTREGTVNIGELYLAYPNGDEIPVRDYLGFTANTGLAEGGEVTRNVLGGLKLDVAEGECFISVDPEQGVQEFYWASTTLDMTDDSHSWIVVNSAGVVTEVFAAPNHNTSVELAEVVTRAGTVDFLSPASRVFLYQKYAQSHIYRNVVNGPKCVSGCTTTANAVPLKLNFDGGTFYITDNEQVVVPGAAVTFTAWYRDALGAWVAVPGQTLVDDEQYNDVAGGLAAIPGGEYTGHFTYIANTEDGPEYHLVYGQMTDAAKANLTAPTAPEWLAYNSARSGQVVVLKSAGIINEINDIRQIAGASVVPGGAVTEHALLGGLGVGNDHPQYQLRTEKDALNGYCGLDAAGKVEIARLDMSAAIPQDVGEPATASAGGGAGAKPSYDDHVHEHGNLTGGTHHAAAVAGVSNGFITAANQTKLDGISANAAALTAAAPADVTKAAADVGASLTAAKADHKHDVSTAVPVAIGTANDEGAATSLARSNHVHNHGAQTEPTHHAAAVAGVSNGFITAASQAKLDALITNAVPQTTTITAGAGLTGGGDLSANRTLDVVANADGSIVANANDIQVGVINVTQHGTLAGGTSHAVVVAGGAAGFMTGADKTKLDTYAATAPVFGLNYQSTSDDATTTTTSSAYTSKITLASGALTGTFRVGFSADLAVNSNTNRYQLRLYNTTTATELHLNEESVNTNGTWQVRGGFVYVTLAGVSQTYALQFASQNNSSTVSCKRARLEFWRVA